MKSMVRTSRSPRRANRIVLVAVALMLGCNAMAAVVHGRGASDLLVLVLRGGSALVGLAMVLLAAVKQRESTSQ